MENSTNKIFGVPNKPKSEFGKNIIKSVLQAALCVVVFQNGSTVLKESLKYSDQLHLNSVGRYLDGDQSQRTEKDLNNEQIKFLTKFLNSNLQKKLKQKPSMKISPETKFYIGYDDYGVEDGRIIHKHTPITDQVYATLGRFYYTVDLESKSFVIHDTYNFSLTTVDYNDLMIISANKDKFETPQDFINTYVAFCFAFSNGNPWEIIRATIPLTTFIGSKEYDWNIKIPMDDKAFEAIKPNVDSGF